MSQPFDRSTIPGWGADLDRADRPAVPMERKPPRLEGVHWSEPSPQPPSVEILQSIEYFRRPPVFGTSVPPRGVSGWIRRRAFRHSENNLRHWLMLLAADRVDAVEGFVADARRSPRARNAALVGGVALAGLLLARAARR
ncbi:hypothetical protein [Luteibacter sp. 9135]|uniref:hypothetical protein n=1 Tax=Luteibacter sp. 9135 TaxID=1500893 RepID=UPI00068F5496|nr:hypothetical protein [Luteibacter sp. 9135]